MPQAIPAIVAALKATAFTIGTYAVTYGTVAKVALLAGSVVYSRRQQKKAMRSLARIQDQGTTVSFADPVASARIVYGEVRCGGTTVFSHTTGTKNEVLHLVLVHCLDGVSELGEVYYGDEALLLPWNGGSPPNNPGVGSRFRDKVLVNKKVTGGAADADLAAAAPTKWTTDHKLTGLCSTYHRLTWDADTFPQGASFNISVMIKGRPCYDPRTTTTVWTANPALILRDYLITHQGVPSAEIDDADVTAAANICDESVTIADATTASRYTCNLVLDTADAPPDNRKKIAACMSGWVAKVGGKWRMQAGAHKSSALSLTMADFRGPISFQAQDSISASCNGIRAVYLDPQNNWQPADAQPVYKIVTAPNITAGTRCTILSVGTTNFTAIGASANTVGVTFTATGAGTGTGTVDPYMGADNGQRRWRDIDLYGTTSHAEAQRLMRIELERARHELTLSAPVMMRGLQVQAGDYVDLTESRYGWTNKLFEAVRHRTIFDAQEHGIAIGCDLTLREVSSAIYTRASADETSADPSPNTDMQRPWEIAAPTSLVLASGTTELVKLKDGTIVERLKASWTAPADPYVTGGGRIEVAYKKSADTPWLPSEYVPGDATLHYMSPVIQGTNYDVRVRSINPLGVSSDWVAVTAHTLVGKTAAPNPVTSLTATAAPGAILLKWINPTDVDLLGVQIYQNATNSKPASPAFWVAAPGNTYTHDGLSGGDVRYYWVVAVDTTINISTDATANATAEAIESATLMYRGAFAAANAYWDNDQIKNLVLAGGSYYKANNPAKDGLTTWSSPPSADWAAFTPTPDLVATGVVSGTGELAVTLSGTLAKFGTRSQFLSGPGGGSSFMMLRAAGDPVGDMSIGLFHGGTDATIELGPIPVTGAYVPTVRLTASTGAALLGAVTCGAVSATSVNVGGATPCILYGSSGSLRVGSTTSAIDRDVVARGFNAGTGGLTALDGSSELAVATVYGGARLTGWDLTVRTTGGANKFTVTAATGALWCGAGGIDTDGGMQVDGNANFGAALGCAGIFTVGAAAQIDIGTDCNLYRSAVNTLKTDDALTVAGALTASGSAYVKGAGLYCAASGGASEEFYWVQGTGVISRGVNMGVVDTSYNVRALLSQTSGYYGLYVNSDLVVTVKKTGWAAASGTATRSTFATSTVTTEQLAERVKALIDDLSAHHGLIG
jgi:hypothetical protein